MSRTTEADVHYEYDGYVITTEKSLMHPEDIYRWMSESSYWAKHIPREVFQRAFDNSYCIGVVKDGHQMGFARLVTDYATFAYLADVVVLDEHRGKGLSKEMIRLLFDLQWVKGLRRLMLATKDAHDLYRKVGFKNSSYPDRIMEITRPNIYGDMETIC